MEKELIKEVTEHFSIYTDALEDLLTQEVAVTIEGEQFDFHYIDELLEILVDVKNIKELMELHLTYAIIGKGSYGVIITSKKYPEIVYKWYFDGFQLNRDKELPDCKHIGYAYSNNLPIPNSLTDSIVKVYHADGNCVIMEYLDILTVASCEREYKQQEQLYIEYMSYYISVLVEGYYVEDYTEYNMTFANGRPMLVDLDLFKFSKVLKHIMEYYTDEPFELFEKLDKYSIFGSVAYAEDIFIKAYTKHKETKKYKITSNPLV